MRYGQIREVDVSNGEGVRTSFFVTGCSRNCYDCFNKEYQDFSAGKLWTEEETNKIIEYLKQDYISGLSILGGEPFENTLDLIEVLKKIKEESDKSIWIWSGFTLEELSRQEKNIELLNLIDVLVDGEYVDGKKDLTLRFRGSTNQRVIDVKKSILNKKTTMKKGY